MNRWPDLLNQYVDDTGIEPVTSSVSGKRSPAELIVLGNRRDRLRADDGIRTRDPHLGKVMLYQLSHVRMLPGWLPLGFRGPATGRTVPDRGGASHIQCPADGGSRGVGPNG